MKKVLIPGVNGFIGRSAQMGGVKTTGDIKGRTNNDKQQP